jgi:hypothetical protein
VLEFETDPFSDFELDVIDVYWERTSGIPDCFDLAGDGLNVPGDSTTADTIDLIQGHFGMLQDWHDAIATLCEGLHFQHEELSTAAARFAGAQLLEWHQAREDWRADALRYFLGSDSYGYPFDSPRVPEGSRYVDGVFWISA